MNTGDFTKARSVCWILSCGVASQAFLSHVSFDVSQHPTTTVHYMFAKYHRHRSLPAQCPQRAPATSLRCNIKSGLVLIASVEVL